MKKYLVILEKTRTGYSAFCPDVPGCVSTGRTKPNALHSMRKALEVHIDELKAEGEKIPLPRASSSYVEISLSR